MDTIAQEWYTIASQDPEAILLRIFNLAELQQFAQLLENDSAL
jgi:hypothetical protein